MKQTMVEWLSIQLKTAQFMRTKVLQMISSSPY